jgi:hypothetical protein
MLSDAAAPPKFDSVLDNVARQFSQCCGHIFDGYIYLLDASGFRVLIDSAEYI